jgi:hypothetical protein
MQNDARKLDYARLETMRERSVGFNRRHQLSRIADLKPH